MSYNNRLLREPFWSYLKVHFIEVILRALEIFNMLSNEDGVQMLLQMNVTWSYNKCYEIFWIYVLPSSYYLKCGNISRNWIHQYWRPKQCNFNKFVTKKIMLGNYIMQNYVPKILWQNLDVFVTRWSLRLDNFFQRFIVARYYTRKMHPCRI